MHGSHRQTIAQVPLEFYLELELLQVKATLFPEFDYYLGVNLDSPFEPHQLIQAIPNLCHRIPPNNLI